MADGVLIGHAYRDSHCFEVYAWRNYGVVAPTFTTTNGSAMTLAGACTRYEPIDESLRSDSIVEMLRAGYSAAKAAWEGGKHG